MLKEIKNMPMGKKMEYIWDYYKIHIIVAILVVIAAAYTINTQINSSKTVFNMTISGGMVNTTELPKFEEKLTKLLLGNKKHEKVLVDFLPSEAGANGTRSLNYQYTEKFFAETMASSIDVAVLEKKDFMNFASQGGFVPLDNTGITNLKGLKTVVVSGNKVKKAIYGIEMNDNKKLQEAGYDTQNKVIGILVNSKNKDKGLKLLNWLVE